MIFLLSVDFFSKLTFEKLFQGYKYTLSVKQFGSKSGSKLFAKVYPQAPAVGKELKTRKHKALK